MYRESCLTLRSEFTDKSERNCHFPARGRNCIDLSQYFPDTNQVWINNKKIKLWSSQI